jgi:rhodanese-related sulfurtransferase
MTRAKVKDLKAPDEAFIDTAGLALLVRSSAPVHVLDARPDDYDDGKRIPGARQLPYNTDEKGAAEALANQDSLVVTYCSNLHCPMSRKLARRLRQLGYENVLVYPDGLAGWIAAGYPVEQVKEQQKQEKQQKAEKEEQPEDEEKPSSHYEQ